MRVLQYCPIPNMAGASRSMLTLIRELSKSQPTYAVVFFDDELAQAAREAGAEVRAIYGKAPRPRSRIKRLALASGCLLKAIRDWQIDIVHVQTAFGNRHAWPAARLTGTRLLTHQRDNYEPNNYHRLLDRADRVIAISNWVRQGLPNHLQARTDVIYNAVDLPPLPDTELPVRARRLVVGMAGRCLPIKGFDVFLDAVGRLDPSHQVSITMWGVPPAANGDDYCRKLWEQIEQLPTTFRERIQVASFRIDIDEFYRSVDLVVVPSRFPEPFGRMAIEAMAWRRPVVVAGHGGLTEAVTHGETGMLFRPLDAADLADKLTCLFTNEDLRNRLATRGRQEVEHRFSTEAHVRAVKAVYERLV